MHFTDELNYSTTITAINFYYLANYFSTCACLKNEYYILPPNIHNIKWYS